MRNYQKARDMLERKFAIDKDYLLYAGYNNLILIAERKFIELERYGKTVQELIK
jgi:hypothetical protein